MKIEHYIARLLYRYQCVTVPGFGAFLTEFQSAQIQESSHAFYPPRKRVAFNPLLKNNDGLLANHIAEAEKSSYDSAVEAIRNEVSIWNDILKVNGRFSLKNIGELSLNSEGNVVFLPSEQVNYLTQSFGLSSFVSPKVKREEYKEEVRAMEEVIPIAVTPEAREELVITGSNRSWMKYAAVFLLALTASGGVGYGLFQRQVKQETLAVHQQVQQQVQQRIQQATFTVESPLPAVTMTIREEKMPYHIVAGVFRSPENASNATEELRKLGFAARRIPKNRMGLYPVLYGSYPDLPAAKTALENIHAKRDKDAWILTKNL